MDLNQIAVFVRVVDSGSFTQAARFLRQPKSRVSRRVASLEKDLGVALLYRTTRQFSLTDAGRILYNQCRQQVYELEGAVQALHERGSEVAGLLRITAAEDVGASLLGPLIAELTSIHPKLKIEVHLSNGLMDLVREGMDVAIRIGHLEDANLKSRSLGKITFVLVASPDYLKRSSRIERLMDLSEHPALVFNPESEQNEWRLKSDGRREQTVKIRVHTRSNSPKVLLDLALAGMGIGLLPEFLCVDALKDGSLKRVLAPYSTPPVPIQLVWPAHREMSPKLRAFIDLAIERLSKYFS